MYLFNPEKQKKVSSEENQLILIQSFDSFMLWIVHVSKQLISLACIMKVKTWRNLAQKNVMNIVNSFSTRIGFLNELLFAEYVPTQWVSVS